MPWFDGRLDDVCIGGLSMFILHAGAHPHDAEGLKMLSHDTHPNSLTVHSRDDKTDQIVGRIAVTRSKR